MGNLPNINWLAGILQSTGIRSLWPWPLMLLHRHEHFIWLEFLPNSISHHFQKNKDDMMIVQFLYPASEDIITFTIPRRFLVAQTPISLWFRNPVNTKWYGDGERFLAKCFQDFTRCCKISSSNNNNSQNSVLHLTPHTHTDTHTWQNPRSSTIPQTYSVETRYRRYTSKFNDTLKGGLVWTLIYPKHNFNPSFRLLGQHHQHVASCPGTRGHIAVCLHSNCVVHTEGHRDPDRWECCQRHCTNESTVEKDLFTTLKMDLDGYTGQPTTMRCTKPWSLWEKGMVPWLLWLHSGWWLKMYNLSRYV